MKQNMKRVLLGLCMAVCLFSLSACGKEQETGEADPAKASSIEQTGTSFLKQFADLKEEEIDEVYKQLSESENESDLVLAAAVETWKTTREELGGLVSMGEAKVEKTEEGYCVNIDAVFEKRAMTFSLGENEGLTKLTFISFDPVYTTAEKLEQAGLNTLLGMGTVFILLIFISLLIGCFKYINQFEEKARKRGEQDLEIPVPAAVPVSTPVPSVEENLTDDLELVAVITAAIAASTGSSPSGLVVRSIRRAPVSKWKKA